MILSCPIQPVNTNTKPPFYASSEDDSFNQSRTETGQTPCEPSIERLSRRVLTSISYCQITNKSHNCSMKDSCLVHSLVTLRHGNAVLYGIFDLLLLPFIHFLMYIIDLNKLNTVIIRHM